LDQIVTERRKKEALHRAGLAPTKSALFTGPPGVGKSLAARWVARQLDLPLVVLDLSAVMSSFLGRTGNNLRYVLDYAKTSECVLLLDEFDCVAKRRDDLQEVGELKRLVTVLLQEIDDWPPTKLLLAATNHGELLDPAAWRRFEMLIEFPLPNEAEIRQAVRAYLGEAVNGGSAWESLLVHIFQGCSFNDIERQLLRVRREAVVFGEDLEERLKILVNNVTHSMPQRVRIEVATGLVRNGASQREAHRLTGVSRDTIRSHLAALADSAKEL
jgi:SpoVK/Ycf46/Vps4 family AAA+-type ATPase